MFRIIVRFILLVLLLAACAQEDPAPAVESDGPAVETPLTPPDEPQPTETAVSEPTPVPTIAAPTANLTDSCVEAYDESVDYFPQKAAVTHADGFTIDYFNNYKVVTVLSPFPGAESTATYVLVQCGTPAPDRFDDATVIEVPVQRFVSLSTTYLPFLAEFDLLDRLVGLDNGSYVSTVAVRELIDAGALVEIGSGSEVNVEAALDLEPDLVMTFASGSSDFDTHPKLQEVDIPVVLNSDYLETTPLGRAEWGEFLAVFFNADGAAEAWFDEVAAEYESLIALAAGAAERPSVFTETPFQGTWFVPGGRTATARLLANAGADYVWADDESTGSLFLDFETVFDQAADADYWLNLGVYGSQEGLLAADERFAEFAAFENGRLYNNDARTNEFGSNDYFESGVANPHLILADVVKIFYPDLLPDHELVYYRPLQ